VAELLSGIGPTIGREQCPAASSRTAGSTAAFGCANCSNDFDTACGGCDNGNVRERSTIPADCGFNGEHVYDTDVIEHAFWDGRNHSAADVCATYAWYTKSNG